MDILIFKGRCAPRAQGRAEAWFLAAELYLTLPPQVLHLTLPPNLKSLTPLPILRPPIIIEKCFFMLIILFSKLTLISMLTLVNHYFLTVPGKFLTKPGKMQKQVWRKIFATICD